MGSNEEVDELPDINKSQGSAARDKRASSLHSAKRRGATVSTGLLKSKNTIVLMKTRLQQQKRLRF